MFRLSQIIDLGTRAIITSLYVKIICVISVVLKPFKGICFVYCDIFQFALRHVSVVIKTCTQPTGTFPIPKITSTLSDFMSIGIVMINPAQEVIMAMPGLRSI